MAKRYITSDSPRLAQTSRPIKYITGKSKIRQPVKTRKMILKEHIKSRTLQTRERAKPIPPEMVEWLQSLTG